MATLVLSSQPPAEKYSTQLQAESLPNIKNVRQWQKTSKYLLFALL